MVFRGLFHFWDIYDMISSGIFSAGKTDELTGTVEILK